MRSYGLVLLACLASHTWANASDADVLKEFGMWGRLAVDCAAPHGENNPHFRYSLMADGKVAYTVTQGRYHEHRTLRNPRLLPPERLEYESADLIVTWAKIEGKYSLQRMVRTDGIIYVENGTTTRATSIPHKRTFALVVCKD